MSERTSDPEQDRDARALVELVRRAHGPPPLTAARRAQMRGAVEERLERQRRPWFVPAAAATALVAGVAAALLVPDRQRADRDPAPRVVTEGELAPWEEAFDEARPDGSAWRLPDDYAAIDSYLVEG